MKEERKDRRRIEEENNRVKKLSIRKSIEE
jgi:hypothetical protein